MTSFSEQGNASSSSSSSSSSVPHFTFAHLSTLTHNYFNHAGYADRPFHRFLSAFFERKLHQNTVILFYADHHLRFGSVSRTAAFAFESRLPFFYVYLPDSLVLNGLKAPQLRRILALNAHRLTSHYDLHPTMLHILEGSSSSPPERNHSSSEPFGVSLLTEVPENRTCPEAGIAEQYCLCNDLRLLDISSNSSEQLLLGQMAAFVVEHINGLLENSTINNTNQSETTTPSLNLTAEGKANSSSTATTNYSFCVPLTLKAPSERRVFSSVNQLTGKEFRSFSFTTMPGDGSFEAMVEVAPIRKKKRGLESVQNSTSENRTSISSWRILRPAAVTSVTRTNAYAGQSDCVKGHLDIVAFCYCSELLKKKEEG